MSRRALTETNVSINALLEEQRSNLESRRQAFQDREKSPRSIITEAVSNGASTSSMRPNTSPSQSDARRSNLTMAPPSARRLTAMSDQSFHTVDDEPAQDNSIPIFPPSERPSLDIDNDEPHHVPARNTFAQGMLPIKEHEGWRASTYHSPQNSLRNSPQESLHARESSQLSSPHASLHVQSLARESSEARQSPLASLHHSTVSPSRPQIRSPHTLIHESYLSHTSTTGDNNASPHRTSAMTYESFVDPDVVPQMRKMSESEQGGQGPDSQEGRLSYHHPQSFHSDMYPQTPAHLPSPTFTENEKRYRFQSHVPIASTSTTDSAHPASEMSEIDKTLIQPHVPSSRKAHQLMTSAVMDPESASLVSLNHRSSTILIMSLTGFLIIGTIAAWVIVAIMINNVVYVHIVFALALAVELISAMVWWHVKNPDPRSGTLKRADRVSKISIVEAPEMPNIQNATVAKKATPAMYDTTRKGSFNNFSTKMRDGVPDASRKDASDKIRDGVALQDVTFESPFRKIWKGHDLSFQPGTSDMRPGTSPEVRPRHQHIAILPERPATSVARPSMAGERLSEMRAIESEDTKNGLRWADEPPQKPESFDEPLYHPYRFKDDTRPFTSRSSTDEPRTYSSYGTRPSTAPQSDQRGAPMISPLEHKFGQGLPMPNVDPIWETEEEKEEQSVSMPRRTHAPSVLSPTFMRNRFNIASPPLRPEPAGRAVSPTLVRGIGNNESVRPFM